MPAPTRGFYIYRKNCRGNVCAYTRADVGIGPYAWDFGCAFYGWAMPAPTRRSRILKMPIYAANANFMSKGETGIQNVSF